MIALQIAVSLSVPGDAASIRAEMGDTPAAPTARIKNIQGESPAEKTVNRFDVYSDKTWKFVWGDEFNGTGIDPLKWQVLEEGPNNLGEGWPEGYRRKDNVYLDGKGNAVIRFSRDKDGN
ncbi:MAG: hypothetical protein GXO95_03190 [Nitrospirae bacterium]|nr:hypothetical protein [Nitrospirota bacterium]